MTKGFSKINQDDESISPLISVQKNIDHALLGIDPFFDEQMREQWAVEAQDLCWDSICILINAIKSPVASSHSEKNGVFGDEIGLIMYQQQLLRVLFAQIQHIPIMKLSSLLKRIDLLLIHDGLGLFKDIQKSLLWDDLYKAISHANAIDYTRRKTLVIWYLNLVHEINTAVGLEKGGSVDMVNKPKLKAKL